MRTRRIAAAVAVAVAASTTAGLVAGSGTANAAAGAAARPVATSGDHGRTDFGFASSSFTSGGKRYLRFDRAVMLTGAAAVRAKIARGIDPTEPPEYYIQNDNPKLRVYRLASNVTVVGSQVLAGTPQGRQVPLQRLLDQLAAGGGKRLALSLELRGGEVVRISEVYLA